MRAQTIFWLLVILCLGLIAVVVAGPPDHRVFEPGFSVQRIAYLTIFAAGIIIIGTARILLRGGVTTVKQSLLWMGLFAAAGYSYANRAEIIAFYDLARGNIYPSVAVSTTPGVARLTRGWDGHYRARAELNGVEEELLVDTGASMVLIPYETVQSIGIDPETLDFSLPVTTANGKSTVARITIDSIKIGDIEVSNVEAAVAQPGRLKSGLLGMTFLDQLSETSFRGGQLFLKN